MHNIWLNALRTYLLVVFVIVVSAEDAAYDVDDESYALQIPELDAEAMAKRSWSQLQGSWGKRTTNEKSLPNYERPSYPGPSEILYNKALMMHDYNSLSDTDNAGDLHLNEKRSWNSINGAWGKRNWNRYRGTGKREGNWNNLRGLWGKRSGERTWNKLSSAWGK